MERSYGKDNENYWDSNVEGDAVEGAGVWVC